MICEIYYFHHRGNVGLTVFVGNSSFRGMQSRSHTIGSVQTCENWKGENLVSNESRVSDLRAPPLDLVARQRTYWFRRILISKIRILFANVSNLATAVCFYADSYFWGFNWRSSNCEWMLLKTLCSRCSICF